MYTQYNSHTHTHTLSVLVSLTHRPFEASSNYLCLIGTVKQEKVDWVTPAYSLNGTTGEAHEETKREIGQLKC